MFYINTNYSINQHNENLILSYYTKQLSTYHKTYNNVTLLFLISFENHDY